MDWRSAGAQSDRLEIRVQRATTVEVEIVVRCSPASAQISAVTADTPSALLSILILVPYV
jgi:hypothetical protein